MDNKSKKKVTDGTIDSSATFVVSLDGDDASVTSSSFSVYTTASQPNDVQVLQVPRPIDQFTSRSGSLDSTVYESTFAPITFRTHLVLLKNEGQALRKLGETLQSAAPARTRSELHSDNAPVQDKGSKTNFMTNSCLCLGSFPKEPPELDPAKRISLDDIIFNTPRINKESGFHLICLNAALPVLSLSGVDGEFVLNTIIEGSHGSLKTIRLEVICDIKAAEGFLNALRHPYLRNMEPGSVVLIKNFTFTESVVGATAKRYLCIQCRQPSSVEFYPRKAFQSIILFDTEEELLRSSRDFEKMYSSRGDVGKKHDGSLWTTLTIEAKHAAEEWHQWGSECSVQRLHTQAYFAYSAAMRFDPENVDLANARSASLISLGLYNAAMKDVDHIISKEPFNTGYILRKVNCYWGLGRLEDALEYLKTLLSKLLQAAALKAKENKSRSRDEEKDACELRRKSMFLQKIMVKTEDMIEQRDSPELLGSEKYFRSSAKTFYDEPEYYNPVLVKYEYPENPNSRKIVIARHEVKAGNLLVVTKALCVVFINDANKHYVDPNEELMNLTIQKIMLDKPTKSSIYKFSCAEETEAGRDCLESERSLEFSKEDVKNLCESCFYSCSAIQEGTSLISGSLNGQTTAMGIWPFLRNIRHTCVGGNAVWYTRGNFLFVRAIRDIRRAEEITMAHIEPTESISKRENFLLQRGMECHCPLCIFEKTEPENVKIKRAALLNEMRFVNTLSSAEWSKDFTEGKLKRLQLCLEDLILLRSAYARLNFPIVEPLLNYGVHMIAMTRYDEAIVAFEKAFLVVDNTTAIYMQILLSLRLSYCHMKKKNRDKVRAKKWFSAMTNYASLLYGCMDPIKYHFKMEMDYLESKGIVAPAKPSPPPRADDLLL